MDDPNFETAAISSDDAAEIRRAEALVDAMQQDGVEDKRLAQVGSILEGMGGDDGPDPTTAEDGYRS